MWTLKLGSQSEREAEQKKRQRADQAPYVVPRSKRVVRVDAKGQLRRRETEVGGYETNGIGSKRDGREES